MVERDFLDVEEWPRWSAARRRGSKQRPCKTQRPRQSRPRFLYDKNLAARTPEGGILEAENRAVPEESWHDSELRSGRSGFAWKLGRGSSRKIAFAIIQTDGYQFVSPC